MKIVTNKDGYVDSFAILGELLDSIEIEDKDINLNFFQQHYGSYKLVNGSLVYDEEKDKQIAEENELERLRILREKECFSVINRGQAWYNSLTAEQTQELQLWYYAWLNVTETKEIPKKPDWI